MSLLWFDREKTTVKVVALTDRTADVLTFKHRLYKTILKGLDIKYHVYQNKE